ncbi:MAG: UvrD-helicase domain-containing protein [Tannerellaceae bacterium]|nr:UvrD-helicase domain-containing protein [Tannerellaceae bacterium]
MEDYLRQLNDAQRTAATFIEGPSLVIAGAGSGKTRVLTAKIAHLLQQGIPPYAILALTFTNKAAREMKARIAAIVGDDTVHYLRMGTFHSIFARILRYESDSIGYPSSFTIYDAADSKSLIKSLIKEMQLDDKLYLPALVQTRISNAKNALITATAYEHNREAREYDFNCHLPLISDLYTRYQIRCRQAGAMDFDDLLLQTYLLFRDHPDVLDKYRKTFRYILVDEYQDTNHAQHALILRLSEEHHHVTLVGDDAQSIYSFRGANIGNILSFQNTYPECKIFLLEQNYRSTRNIVAAANSLIQKNKEQIQKNLFSEREEGTPLRVLSSYSGFEEAFTIAHQLLSLHRQEYSYADHAVLYRTNAQSRLLEEALRKQNIPYRIYGGLSFYQRKEVKDLIAYFRITINHDDEEALRRTINYPLRGIGDSTVMKISTAATTASLSLWNVINNPAEFIPSLNTGTRTKLAHFADLIRACTDYAAEHSADAAASFIVQHSGLLAHLRKDHTTEGISRLENTEELLRAIAEFVQIRREENSDAIALADYLSDVALLTDQDTDVTDNSSGVTLMTVHSAKGLEFENVFIVGLEEGLFPYSLSTESPQGLEEERRLLYVAITRARQQCFLSYATSRFNYANRREQPCLPSRFFRDIDPQYLQVCSTSSHFRRFTY